MAFSSPPPSALMSPILFGFLLFVDPFLIIQI